MVQIIHGSVDDLGPILQSLVTSIGKFAMPNHLFQLQARQKFLESPELLQKWVDLEKNNPGLVTKLGFGKEGSDFMTGISQSIENYVSQITRPAIESAAAKPEVQADIARQTLKQPDEIVKLERQVSGLEGTAIAEMKPEERQAYIRERLLKKNAVEEVQQRNALSDIKTSEEFAQLSPAVQVQRFLAGKVDGPTLSGIMNSPGRAEGFKAALATYWNSQENYLSRLRIGQSDNDFGERILMMKASRAAQAQAAAGGRGSAAAWYRKVNNGEDPPAILGFGKASEGDVATVEQVIKQNGLEDNLGRQRQFASIIDPLIDKLNRPPKGIKWRPEQIQGMVQQINDAAAVMGTGWKAEYKKVPWYKPGQTGLYFTDAAGNTTDDPRVLESPAAGQMVQKFPPPSGDPAVDNAIKMIMTRQGTLDQLMNATTYTPAQKQAIANAINGVSQ